MAVSTWGKTEPRMPPPLGGGHSGCPAEHESPGHPALSFSPKRHDSRFLKLPALPCLGAAQGKKPSPASPAPTPPYPLADEQAVGVLDGGSLVQQQRLELAFLDVIEGVKHHGQELRGKNTETSSLLDGGTSKSQ